MTAASIDPTGDVVTDLPTSGPGISLVVNEPEPTDLVRIAVSTSGSTVRLSAAGEIDSSSAAVLRREIAAALERPVDEVVIDLDEVGFLDSAGLSALATAHRSATERGVRLRVLASGRAVIRPLQITGLWDLLGAEQVPSGTGSTA